MTRPIPLVRFALNDRQIRRVKREVRPQPRLFAPNKALRLSVFCVEGIGDQKIIQGIGENVAIEKAHNTGHRVRFFGWGCFDESVVDDCGLCLVQDGDGSRHADVVGWPEEVEKRKSLQIAIALSSTAVLLPNPIST